MPSAAKFIITPGSYGALRAREADIFHLDCGGLPDQVFVDGFTRFRFLEFDQMLTPKFWEVLRACAGCFGDDEVSLVVHEPDPENYYFSNFRRYGALIFERGASAMEYYDSLRAEPEGNAADALLYVANVIAWFGTSKQWAFWGDRELGVGIAATRRVDMTWPSVDGIHWFDIDGALSNLMALNFRNQVVPEEFAHKLRINFTR